MALLPITKRISLDERELQESFIQASGPGGQNVNKVATAVQLRFGVRHSSSLPPEVKARLEQLAGSRLTRDGVLVIASREHRTQERNRQDARDKLIELIKAATVVPRKRKATRPTLGSKKRRLDSKTKASRIKKLRGKKFEE
jgi:ribosome-associated protein